MSDDGRVVCFGGPNDGRHYPLTPSRTVTVNVPVVVAGSLGRAVIGTYHYAEARQRYEWRENAARPSIATA